MKCQPQLRFCQETHPSPPRLSLLFLHYSSKVEQLPLGTRSPQRVKSVFCLFVCFYNCIFGTTWRGSKEGRLHLPYESHFLLGDLQSHESRVLCQSLVSSRSKMYQVYAQKIPKRRVKTNHQRGHLIEPLNGDMRPHGKRNSQKIQTNNTETAKIKQWWNSGPQPS